MGGLALGAAALLVVAAAVQELRGQVAPLPQNVAQVPRRWLLWRRRWATAGAFGLVIGTGTLTTLVHAAAWALAAVVFATGSWTVGLLAGLVYGASRGSTLLATWVGDVAVRRRIDWMVLWRRRRLVQAALAALSVATFIALVLGLPLA
jgi:hypothetical protein